MQDRKEFDILSVTTTIGSLEAAKVLAREILAQKLAACVQLDQGVISLYRWKGEVCEEPEVRLVIKTLPGCEVPLRALLAQHHSYELPQFLAQRTRASEGYAQWVRAEVVVPPAAPHAD